MQGSRNEGKSPSFPTFVFSLLVVISGAYSLTQRPLGVSSIEIPVWPDQVVKLRCADLVPRKEDRTPVVLGYSWHDDIGSTLSTTRDLYVKASAQAIGREYSCTILTLTNGLYESSSQSYRLKLRVQPGLKVEQSPTLRREGDTEQRRRVRVNSINAVRSQRSASGQHRAEIVASTDIIDGQPVRINCQVKPPLEQVAYKWFVLPVQFNVSTVNLEDTSISAQPEEIPMGNGPELFVPFAEYQAKRYYRCEASGQSAGNNGAFVTVGTVSNFRSSESMGTTFKNTIFQIEIEPDKTDPILGQPLTLTCNVHPKMDNMQIEWRLDNQVIGREPKLFLPVFNKNDSNTYTCIANGRILNKFDVTMEGKRGIRQKQYVSRVAALDHQQSIIISDFVGSTKELHCEVDQVGLTGKQIDWFLNGQLVDPRAMAEFGVYVNSRLQVTILTINSLSKRNEGRYECRGPRGFRKQLVVHAMEKEKILELNPQVQIISEGDAAEFHCLPQGYSNVKSSDLLWFYLGARRDVKLPLQANWRVIDNVGESNTAFIELNDAQLDEAGFYMCQTPSGEQRVSQLIVLETKQIKVKISPPEISTRVNTNFEINCLSTNKDRMYGRPEWFLIDGRPLSALFASNDYFVYQVEDGKSRLGFPRGLGMEHNNLELVCRLEDKTDKVRIILQNICDINRRRCRNGQCILSSQFCDGVRDCSDGSDEDPLYCTQCDPLEKKCQVWEGRQPIAKVFMANWACDGEDDCGNRFDESNCPAPTSTCDGTDFQCRLSGTSIPRSFHCDKEPDCPNREDEENCMEPSLINVNGGRLDQKRGERVNITCVVRGVPQAKVIWRYNWGCLPSDRDADVRSSRFQVSAEFPADCTTVRSTLTIDDFQPGDDGIYNCEAIIGTKRVMSPDFIVLLGEL